MKKILLITAFAFILFSCQDVKDQANQKLPNTYDKRVGEQIPFDVATRWSKNFSGSSAIARDLSSYSINAETLRDVLNASADRVGVVFHHGTDEAKNHHILMVAMENEGVLFESEVIDLTTGLMLENGTAARWAQRYSEEHTTTPLYHFFGDDIFLEIQSNAAFNYVVVVRGLNDENEEQMLLFVYNTKGIFSARAEGENVTVYDASSPCPPCSSF